MPIGRGSIKAPTSRLTQITSSAPARREETNSPPLFMFRRSPVPEPSSPRTENDLTKQLSTTLQIDIQPLIPDNAFFHARQSPRDNVPEIADAAARNLKRTPPANTSITQLRPNTSAQRKAQPLSGSNIRDIVTG